MPAPHHLAAQEQEDDKPKAPVDEVQTPMVWGARNCLELVLHLAGSIDQGSLQSFSECLLEASSPKVPTIVQGPQCRLVTGSVREPNQVQETASVIASLSQGTGFLRGILGKQNFLAQPYAGLLEGRGQQ